MLFNSFAFLLFFILVLILYYSFKRNYKWQNYLLLLASYFFYGFWDWRFLFLIALSTFVDFFIGKAIASKKEKYQRKRLLVISVFTNLTILGFFKYFNFFSDSFITLFNKLGFNPDPVSLNVILPVGISFYTFQTMSYTIDIYRGKLKPVYNLPDFALFVSFFPQLVAGPIERAINLLPQISKPRKISSDQLNAAIFLILWGYFKKVVIADNMGIIADSIFNNYTSYRGFDLMLGIVAFSIQIYGDFSGYSDIARGLAKLMGFELMVNFRLPYFAVNPSDFWNRWHISLSTWLRDYLYIPLGGNRKGRGKTYRNLGLTMLLGGLWHGAAWNFMIWGAYHGLILSLYRSMGFVKMPSAMRGMKLKPASLRWTAMLIMFILTLLGWLIFRVESMEQFRYFIKYLYPKASGETVYFLKLILYYSSPMLILQVFQHWKKDLLVLLRLPLPLVIFIYTLMLLSVFIFGAEVGNEFIYFQF